MTETGTDEDDVDIVGPGYWASLRAVLSRLPVLPEEPPEGDAEPLI